MVARLRLTVVLIVCALLVSRATVAQEQSIVNGGTIHGAHYRYNPGTASYC